jgi:hypothetical protein
VRRGGSLNHLPPTTFPIAHSATRLSETWHLPTFSLHHTDSATSNGNAGPQYQQRSFPRAPSVAPEHDVRYYLGRSRWSSFFQRMTTDGIAIHKPNGQFIIDPLALALHIE